MYFKNGFERLPNFTTTEELDLLQATLTKLQPPGVSGSVRNIEKQSLAIRQFAESEKVVGTVTNISGGTPKLARVIYFNKTSQRYWLVASHQDRTTAVSKKINCDSWSNLTVKDGIFHAQPPVEAFNEILTLMLHLDKTDQTNECLKVIPGTHLLNVLQQSDVLSHVNKKKVTCLSAHAGVNI